VWVTPYSYLQSLKRIWCLIITSSLWQAISNFGCDPKFRKKIEARELANTLRSCSSIQYDISHCKYVSFLKLCRETMLPLDSHDMTIFTCFHDFVQTETLLFCTQRSYVVNLGISCMFAFRFNSDCWSTLWLCLLDSVRCILNSKVLK
jgi:hypothetical protein